MLAPPVSPQPGPDNGPVALGNIVVALQGTIVDVLTWLRSGVVLSTHLLPLVLHPHLDHKHTATFVAWSKRLEQAGG